MTKDLYVGALLDFYGEFLNPKQRRLAEYYYNDDLSLTEIAENEGITRQGVSDTLKRVKQRLYSFEERCGYCEKILRLKELSKAPGDADILEIKKIIEDL